MKKSRKVQVWSLSTLLSVVTSVICMGSMGAMGIAASAGAAATGRMAGMDGMGTAPSHIAITTQFLQSIGLGILTQIPDTILRPVFVLLLAVGIIGSYIAYRNHHHIGPLLVVVGASVLLYIGIYVSPSDGLYYFSLALLLIGSIWNILVRPTAIALVNKPTTSVTQINPLEE